MVKPGLGPGIENSGAGYHIFKLCIWLKQKKYYRNHPLLEGLFEVPVKLCDTDAIL